VVKKRTTSDAITADEITKVQTIFNQMEAAVDQCSVDKNAFEIQIKQLSIDNDQLWKQIMSQEIVHVAMNYVDILNVNKSCVDECNKCLELETKLLKKKDLIEKDVYDKPLKNTIIRKLKDKIKSLSGKDSVENVKKDIDEIEMIDIELENTLKNELRKLKGKNVVDTAVSKPSATIAPGMFKLDIELILIDLRTIGIPMSLMKPTEKLVVVTPMNKDKKVRFAEPVTSSSNIPKQTDSLRTKDSNKPMLTSIGVNTTTSASGSKPSGNTKKNRIP
ncbi:hypothetical protein Tco_1129610, partial [Tanacetum coccineum]